MARVQPVTYFKATIGLPESQNYKDIVLDNTKCCPKGVKAKDGPSHTRHTFP